VMKFRAKNGGVFGLLLLILLMGCDVVAPDDQYQLGPDSEIQLGVAQCAVRELRLQPSQVYPGYAHRAWLYIPAQYSGQTAIALMVFQMVGPLSHATVYGVSNGPRQPHSAQRVADHGGSIR
jgi:hypothetical protein